MKQTWEDLIARLLIARGAPAHLYQTFLRRFRNRGFYLSGTQEYTRWQHGESESPKWSRGVYFGEWDRRWRKRRVAVLPNSDKKNGKPDDSRKKPHKP